MTAAADTAPREGSWVALRHPGFAFYWCARLMVAFSAQVVSVAVGWQVYDLTRDPLDLGLVGLVQFLPALALVLVTGRVADRFDRRRIVAACIVAEGICALALLGLTIGGNREVGWIFAVLVGFGVARAFIGPAVQSLLPNLVPPEHLAQAIAFNSSAWQIATIVGPVAGGLLYGISPEAAYGVAIAMFVAATVLTALIPRTRQSAAPEPGGWSEVVAGFTYVWRHPIVLGAISLDLFAVLLGGATALLPAFARDVLEVGPWGLGLLRAAPGIGALAVALILVYRPIRDRAGLIMFVCVAIFGLATVLFGLSTTVWLSVVSLGLLGAADMVSVYVRETLIQLATPDEVRGRVNAVNWVFIGASNELGEFRAGGMAHLIGVVPAVVFGGIGTIVVAGLWALWFPELRRAKRLDGR